MKLSDFSAMSIATVHHIIEKIMLLNIKLKIKLPTEPASPFSLISCGFSLITVALVINVIIRYITIQRLIEDPYISLGVYFILTQVILFFIVGGIILLFKGIENAVKRF